MSEVAVLVATAKAVLQELAQQTKTLGVGLEHAAPLGAKTPTNDSVAYLLTVSEVLTELAQDCEQL